MIFLNIFDIDKKGSISISTLRKMMREIPSLKSRLTEIRGGANNRITKNEFIKMFDLKIIFNATPVYKIVEKYHVCPKGLEYKMDMF